MSTKELEVAEPQLLYMNQGSWSAVALLAYKDRSEAISIAKQLELSPKYIHDFDWEKLVDIWGSKQAFLDDWNS